LDFRLWALGLRKNGRRTGRPRLIVWALGAATAAILGHIWFHRVELVEIPWLWSRVRGLAALRETRPDDPAFQPSRRYGLSEFDFAICRLIRLQSREFLGGKDFTLLPLRSREGRPAVMLSYEALTVSFDHEPDSDEDMVETIIFCPVVIRDVTVLDGQGKWSGETMTLHVAKERDGRPAPSRVVAVPEGFDVLRVPAYCQGLDFAGGFEGGVEYEFTVDELGLVSQGQVAGGDLQAPFDALRDPVRVNRIEIDRLLDSPHPGDLHRAVTLLAKSDGHEVHRIEPLLDHRDPALRARAAAVLQREPALARLALPLLADSSPRVRFAALHTARAAAGWERALEPLTRDARPEIARAARCALARSEDQEIARAAALDLLRQRDPWIVNEDYSRFGDAEFAEAIVSWLEADSDEDVHSPIILLPVWFDPETLRPLFPRILALAREHGPEGSFHGDLTLSLMKADEPRAEIALRDLVEPEALVHLCQGARGEDPDPEPEVSPAAVGEGEGP
jgi:hypothetical protein